MTAGGVERWAAPPERKTGDHPLPWAGFKRSRNFYEDIRS